MNFPKLYIIFLAFSLSACATYQQLGIEVASKGTYCSPRNESKYDSSLVPTKNIEGILAGPLSERYPQHLLLIANACGVLPHLRELSDLEKQQTSLINTSSLFQKKQLIAQRVSLVAAEVASLETELNCERDRCQQAINYLSQIEGQKIRRSTVASIVLGAATTIAVAFVSGDEQIREVAISGGVLGAAFGLRTLFVNREIEFLHERNILADIWYDKPTSKVYPASIWYVLTEKSFTETKEFPINHYLRLRFKAQLHSSYKVSKRLSLEKLLFEAGANYGINELRIRENMLSLIQVGVSLTNQDLKLLMLEMAK